MMLDFKISLDKNNILKYLPIGFFVGVVFVSELIIVLINTKFDLLNIQILVNPMIKFENLLISQRLSCAFSNPSSAVTISKGLFCNIFDF